MGTNSKKGGTAAEKNVTLNVDRPGADTVAPSPLSPNAPAAAAVNPSNGGMTPSQNKTFGFTGDNFLNAQLGKNEDLSNPESNRSTNRDTWTAPSAQNQLV